MLRKSLLWCFAILLHATTVLATGETPKNIIILIGDGMGYNHVKAGNYYKSGADSTASFQQFPIQYAMSTYNGTASQEYRSDSAWLSFDWVATSGRYTDSAPAATALSTGKKSYDGAIGVDMEFNNLEHFMTFAESKSKATGVVSSVQFSHATPAGYVAHNTSRNNYEAIATEMLNSNIDVIIGAGHPDYDNNAQAITGTKQYKYVGGEANWNSLKAGTLNGWTFSDDSSRIAEIANGVNVPAKLVAVPRVASTLQQSRTVVGADSPYADAINNGINNLPELSLAAINVLSQNPNGFVLMIEGGAIDWAGHANQKGRLIEEQIDFVNAVDSVIAWVEANGGWDENLVIVTADHETGYLLGPNAGDNKPTTNPMVNNGQGNVPGMVFNSGNHTNMLVPFYAKGVGSELFSLQADREDPICGYFIDNTDVAKTCFALWSEIADVVAIKNVIYMISDGWGENHIVATNYFEGQTQEFEEFPTYVYMSTYHGMGTKGSTDISQYYTSYNSGEAWSDTTYIKKNYTDSAPAATAMGGGIKVYDGSINKDNQLLNVKTLSEIAKDKGRAAGVVSSVQFSHATPAAFGAAHNETRNDYAGIANEMLASNLDVIIGAGHPEYNDNGVAVTGTKQFKYVGGETTWNALKAGSLNSWYFTDEKSRIQEIAAGTNVPAKLCAVAKAGTTIQQSRSGDGQVVNNSNFNPVAPTLVDMTNASLKVLGQNSNGFFVMIEGGAVDWACHANQKGRLIEEQSDFNRSVDAVIDWVETNSNWDETLLIVTGDHETGYLGSSVSQDLGVDTIINNGAGVMPGMKFYSGNHTNMLVPFYAKGVGADILKQRAGVYDIKRGYYIENTDAANLIKSLWMLQPDVTTEISEHGYSSLFTNEKLIVVPNGNELKMMAKEYTGSANVILLNVSGQIIASEGCQFDNGVSSIKSNDLCQGVYFAFVNIDNVNYSAKFIIK